MVARALLRRAAHGAFTVATLVSRPLTGPPPSNDRGVRLDRQCHVMLALLERSGMPTLDQLGPEGARAELERQRRLVDAPPEPLARVEDRSIPGVDGDIPVRIYTPRTSPDPLPAVVYFHGGGFVVGDLESHDAVCRHLCRRADVTVIAVDYRLAPEDPFPAAVEDACSAFRWVHANADSLGVDPDRVAIGGDSAGGNLSAVVCQQMRAERHPMPCFQLLLYPATDLTRSAESHETFREGYFLDRPLLDWFLANYLTSTDQERDPRGSPLVTADLEGLPPAHVVVAGFDPLRDEGEAYAQALMAAGVPTTLRCYGSLVHGFYSMGGLIEAARWASEDIAMVVHRALWPE